MLGQEIVLIVLLILVVLVVLRSIRIIPQQQIAIVERLGKYHRSLSAGINLIFPFIDRVARRLDLKTQQVSIPTQEVITKDNVKIRIDTVFFYTVIDPKQATYNIFDFVQGIQNITASNIRQVVGHMELDETLSGRDRISFELRQSLDEVTETWGVRIDRVEVVDIHPPIEIQASMEKQMKAEREKRANILQAEGERQAAILRAEGEKQSIILRAEADKEANIRQAEGLQQALILEANGQAESLRLIANGEKQRIQMLVEAGLDERVLAFQSFDALKQMAQGTASTIFVPTDAVGVLGSLGAIAKVFQTASTPTIDTSES
ncbi:SPFH domain-containing protein [Ferroacidibacillus organovorans]|uniref:Peptidase n=1 Tax=Ferroacidibacillus organovorans TaxID=1765683 RepID=A0A1V4ETU4_9BACL|nr:SPFH domain-containing protein [Ferroacidibacillus organovorans]OPG16357.1 peptidase [Ferroacidibacillus organovorans]